jgi:hypothetical protein
MLTRPLCPACKGSGFAGDFPGIGSNHWRTKLMRQWCEDAGIEVDARDTVSRKDAARLLNRSVYTLRNWTLTGKGPPCVSFNRRYRYALADVSRYLHMNWKRLDP